MNIELLKLLNRNAHYTTEQLSVMLGISEEEVKTQIADMEKKGIIGGYKAVVDWDTVNDGEVSAIIALNVVPKADLGFEEVAARVAAYEQVESVYLLSGGYDLHVVVKAKTLQDVARFVARELATIDSVTSTTTHFVMRRYKEMDIKFCETQGDDRGKIII